MNIVKLLVAVLLIFILPCKDVRAQSCSGTPAGGVATATILVPCGTERDTIQLSGYATGSGINFQWLTSPDAVTWTPIAGATNPTYPFTPSAVVYYMARSVCTITHDTAYSNQLKIFYDSTCPCLPVYYIGFDHTLAIHTFMLNCYGGSYLYDRDTTYPAYYERRTDTISLQQGHNYAGSIIASSAGYFCENEIWIDFNDNGLFEPSENVSGIFVDSSSFGGIDSFTVRVPLYADTGIHRMRVRNAMHTARTFSTAMDPCYFYDNSTGSFIFYEYGST